MFHIFPFNVRCWFCFTKPFRHGDALAIVESNFVDFFLKFSIWAELESKEGIVLRKVTNNLFLLRSSQTSRCVPVPLCKVKMLKGFIDGERFRQIHNQLGANQFIALLYQWIKLTIRRQKTVYVRLKRDEKGRSPSPRSVQSQRLPHLLYGISKCEESAWN